MGANILANALGEEGDNCFFDAACVVQAPMKLWLNCDPIRNNCFGFYNHYLGQCLVDLYSRQRPMLKEMYKEKLKIDLDDEFANTKGQTIMWFDDKMLPPQFGFKDRTDYYT